MINSYRKLRRDGDSEQDVIDAARSPCQTAPTTAMDASTPRNGLQSQNPGPQYQNLVNNATTPASVLAWFTPASLLRRT
jgi:hypothetical protein